MKGRQLNIGKKQNGYIMIITIVLLAILLTSTLSFFDRSTRSMKTTVYNRDSSEALLLAESAMNSLIGQYSVKDVDNRNGIDGDELLNMDSIFNAAVNFPTLDQPLCYLYFSSQGGTAIDNKTPSILQRIANGEAIGLGTTLNSKLIDESKTQLLISNLFIREHLHPVVFTLENNNLLQIQNNHTNVSSWNAILKNNEKLAVAWFEVVKNPDLMGSYQIYVSSIGLVGATGSRSKSKSYVQRLLGTISSSLGTFSLISQDS